MKNNFDKIVNNLKSDNVTNILNFKDIDTENHEINKVLRIYQKAINLVEIDSDKASLLARTALYKSLKSMPSPVTRNLYTINKSEIDAVIQIGIDSKSLNQIWKVPPTIMPQLISFYIARDWLNNHTPNYGDQGKFIDGSIKVHGKSIIPFKKFADSYSFIVFCH